MDHNVFLLATDPNNPCNDVIHSRGTNFKVKVVCLDSETFRSNARELQLYGYAGPKLYAFETINISPEDAPNIVDAIRWYADYIDYPEMEILPEDPRPGGNIPMIS
jgi:hypothetical protein